MKRPSAAAVAASLLLGSLWPGTVVVTKADDAFVVREGDVNYRVVTPDPEDRPNARHVVRFRTEGIGSSVYRFGADLRIRFIRAGVERYAIRYADDGSLRRVVRKADITTRMLLGASGEEGYDLDNLDKELETLAVDFNYHCSDCQDDWNDMCSGEPLSTVCALQDHEDLGDTAADSVDVMCNTFGSLCTTMTAAEACDGFCFSEYLIIAMFSCDDMPAGVARRARRPTPT